MGLAVLAACGEPFYCTPGAATWQVTVLDAQGAPVPDLRWTAVIERTHDTIPATLLAAHSDPAHGTYAIFTDAVRDRIDPTGEVVRVEGASGTEWFSAAFTFAVPQADCYANRVSGPDTVTLAPAAFALVNADRAWGGGDILVVSPVLRLVDSLPFLVDGDTAWSHAIAGDTAAVTAPVNTGAYGVEVVRGEVAELLGTTAVRGYAGAAPGPPLSGIIQAWPRGSVDPTFLANGPNQLHLVDAASRTVVRVFDDSIHNPLDGDDHCTRGPGPTYDPNIFILCPERSTRVAFDIGTDPPVRVEEVCFTDSGYRLAGLIAPGYWLSVFSNLVYLIKCPGADSDFWSSIRETEIIRISPRGDRTLVLGNEHHDDGAPVIDIAGLVYWITEFAGTGAEMGAGFSSDGATLYAGMWKAVWGGTRVLKLDATSGTILAQTTLMGMGYPGDLLVDSDGGWVYVLGVRAGQWTLSVLDAETLATVAVLEPGSGACGPDWPVSLVLGSNQDAVFVVRTHGYWQYVPPGNSCIQRFDVWRY
jgi:DNA-binding beta-propeller fold protein YncE